MPYNGAIEEDDCIPCIGTQYCPNTGMSAYLTQTCPGGYYCDADGTQHACEAGFFCPAGDILKYRCDHGTYQDALGSIDDRTVCTPCTAGQYCQQPSPGDGTDPTHFTDYYAGADAEEPCPKGFYCESQTSIPG
jgi:hypothetical protein